MSKIVRIGAIEGDNPTKRSGEIVGRQPRDTAE